MSCRPLWVLVYTALLPLSMAGSWLASQFDAPYGWKAELEAMTHAAAGWLILLLPVLYAARCRSRGALAAGLVAVALGFLLAYSYYDLYRELYEPYASSLMSRPEYVASSVLFFVLGAALGVAGLPMLVLELLGGAS